MLSIQINDLKKFTGLLFTEDAFDRFLLHDACFRTAITTSIEGTKNPSFYPEEVRAENMKQPCIYWKEARDLCFQLIKGKNLPLQFRIILITASETTAYLIRKADFDECKVSSFSLNITFKEQVLTLTTGVSYEGFTLDKTPENVWDKTVIDFIEEKEIPYENLL